MYDAWQSVDN